METEELHQQAFDQLYEKMTQNGEITGVFSLQNVQEMFLEKSIFLGCSIGKMQPML